MQSDNAKSGMQQAPARSLFNALGFTPEELKKPMVGIVSCYSEMGRGDKLCVRHVCSWRGNEWC